MTGEELGTTLGDAISQLEYASTEIEETVSRLFEVDGKAILLEDDDNEAVADKPSMTVDELGELLADAVGMLESVVAEIESAMDMLQSIDGQSLAAGESDEATGEGN